MASSKPSYVLRPEPKLKIADEVSNIERQNAVRKTIASRLEYRPCQACDREGLLYAQGCVESSIVWLAEDQHLLHSDEVG